MVTLFYDLASPYAYLTAARLADDARVTFAPVLAGAIFAQRGRGSWAHTEARAQNVAEIEARAARYGLPPIAWPEDWPGNSLRAMRAAVWAHREGAGRAFALACFAEVFARGRSVSDPAVLEAGAAAAQLDPQELAGAVEDPAIKAELQAATARAWALGVRGVPTVLAREQAFFGDDRADEALALHGG